MAPNTGGPRVAQKLGAETRVTIYRISDGEPLQVYPVDAKELCRSRNPDGTRKKGGPEYTMTQPDGGGGRRAARQEAEPSPDPVLMDLPEVGAKRAELLAAEGYDTVAKVAEADPAALAEVLGVGVKVAESITAAAGGLMGAEG